MKKTLYFLAIMTIMILAGCANAQKPAASKNILVAYISRTGNTRAIAHQIYQLVGGDTFRIETDRPYPANYDSMVKQATLERESGYKPPLKSKVLNMAQYDVVFVGFPIWGMALPSPVRSFLSQYDLAGKTVVPFCTHGGYGMGSSFQTVAELCPNSKILKGFEVRGGMERDGQYLVLKGEKAKETQVGVKKWLQEIGLVK